MFTFWAVATFLAGVALELWFLGKVGRFLLEMMTRGRAIMKAEQRTRVTALRAEELAYARGEFVGDDDGV